MADAMPMPFSCTCRMPLGPAANANGMCSWGWTKSNAHGPRLKAGGLVGLRGTIRYKRVVEAPTVELEVFLEAHTAFVLRVGLLHS